MVRLIKANLLRLRHSTVFLLCMAFSFGASLYFTVSRAVEVDRQPGFYAEINPMYSSPEMVMFGGGVFLIFAVAVFVALFIGIDYSDGVIRNKLIIGHERMAVYGANLLTAVIVSLLIIAV